MRVEVLLYKSVIFVKQMYWFNVKINVLTYLQIKIQEVLRNKRLDVVELRVYLFFSHFCAVE